MAARPRRAETIPAKHADPSQPIPAVNAGARNA
jgi:hypothetical protein